MQVHAPAGWSVRAFETLESTNRTARDLVEQGQGREGLVIWARTQTGGRGRGDRIWESRDGNLFASCLIRAPLDSADAAQLSFVAALAVCRAIERVCPPARPRCKWPNDVLCHGGKVAGLLLEMVPRAPGRVGGDTWIVVGIGINLRHAPETGALHPAVALADFGCQVPLETLLSTVLAGLAEQVDIWRTEGFAPIRQDWIDHAFGLGRAMTVRLGDARLLPGLFEGVDARGHLLLRPAEGGAPLSISAGDVFFPDGDIHASGH